MKFPTPNGISELKGDRSTSRECYNTSPTKKAKGKAFTMENLDRRNELNEARAKPVEDLTKVRLSDEEPKKAIQISSMLPNEVKASLLEFLKEMKISSHGQ